jgi:ribosomal protein S11
MRKQRIQKRKKNQAMINVKNSNKPTPQKLWVKKPIRYSSYLHLLIISSFRRNVFFTLTNSEGQVKYSTTAGQSGFTGEAKVARLALVTVTENFIQRI